MNDDERDRRIPIGMLPIPPESLLQRLLDDIPIQQHVAKRTLATHRVHSQRLVLCAIVLFAATLSIWLAIEYRDWTKTLAIFSVSSNTYFQEWGTDPCYVQPPLMD